MEPLQLIVQQGKSVLECMKDLKRIAHKKGKDRSKVFERFTANKHSVQVYTNIDASIRENNHIQNFLQKLQSFSNEFEPARYDFEGEVNVSQVEELYPQVIEAYNAMVTELGQSSEVVNFKYFK
ncbi:hypothetical protein [Lysinibacillus sp. BW-2-10]|uniref:hypothetical protein n=1 Tax=Lysinibacillus sp. BW-2-10 TaxID=2590030 RepID=UPI001180DDF4|nr:hypothetical protein [Lysinibacillus sp. BW-2-10]TSI09683.1 hypothetical protein FJQ64_04715 [Lysinibacillus sp. BW-2-10]